MRLTREAVFQVCCETPFGAEVRVVGSSESLGRWDPTRGFRLDTSPKLYPTWRSRSAALLEEGEVEYKYVVALPGSGAIWESCPNRRLPALQHGCQAVLVQGVFGSRASERAVQLRPFPDRRAFSHLRKGRNAYCTMSLWRSAAGGGPHEEPAGKQAAQEGFGWVELVPCLTDISSCSGTSGITRASSTESISCLEAEDEQNEGRRTTLLVWPQIVPSNGGVACIEVYGSFTRPAWTTPLTLHLCPETGVWWIAIEEALPLLQPGTYEFKFLVNHQVWMTNPALPVSRNLEGVENNKLRIDYRLLTRIERKAEPSSLDDPLEDPYGFFNLECGGADAFVADRAVEEARKGGQPPRRAVSTAERLCRVGSVRGAMDDDSKQRTLSLPHLTGKTEFPGDVASAYDLVGGAFDGGTLYDRDVALLLELPDLKRQTGLMLDAGAFYRPKDGTGDGEDAHFIEVPALGVADGVGGLQPVLGYTSKAFADELMGHCAGVARDLTASGGLPCSRPSETSERILCEGFLGVTSYGASTAAVAYLDTSANRLGIAVLGDSGVMVIRRPTNKCFEDVNSRMPSTRSRIVFKSPPQQHDFNYPFQLCRLPQVLLKLVMCRPDRPTDCAAFDIEVEEGDLVLVYSDGLDDNLHDEEILDICDRALSPYAAHVLGLPAEAASPPELLARAVGSAAYARSRQEVARTPFAKAARNAGWPVAWCRGGKEDDITVVAAWVLHGAARG